MTSETHLHIFSIFLCLVVFPASFSSTVWISCSLLFRKLHFPIDICLMFHVISSFIFQIHSVFPSELLQKKKKKNTKQHNVGAFSFSTKFTNRAFFSARSVLLFVKDRFVTYFDVNHNRAHWPF